MPFQRKTRSRSANLFIVQPDRTERLLASGLNPVKLQELQDWFCYTKPVGTSMKIVARRALKTTPIFRVVAAGTEPGPPEE
jgi:hypothetical protein